jgi:hypothetical protein
MRLSSFAPPTGIIFSSGLLARPALAQRGL